VTSQPFIGPDTALREALDRAWNHYRAGQWQQAEQHYRQILQQEPNQVDALHLLGMIAGQSGRYAEAAGYLQATVRLRPDFAAAHSDLGTVFILQQRFAEAVGSFREAVRSKPDFASAYSNLGNALRELGDLDEAVANLRKAVQLRPDFVEAHLNLGIALEAQGKLDDAAESYRQAVHYRPSYADAHFNLGNVLIRQGKPDEAAAHLQETLRFKGNDPGVHHSLAVALKTLGKADQAIAHYQQALRLKPDADVHIGLGNAFQEGGDLPQALAHYRQATLLQPDNFVALSNLGNALQEMGHLEEAQTYLERALALKPDFVPASFNLGIVHWKQGRLDEAESRYQQTIRLQPDHVDAHRNLGMLWLLRGDWIRGLPEYEFRPQGPKGTRTRVKGPSWDGSPLNGRTIVLHAEQGLGDTLQFVRYAARVKERGGTVVLACQAPLYRLLESAPGVDQLVKQGDPLPSFDAQAHLMSLAHIMGTTTETVPANIPYLAASKELVEKWRPVVDKVCGFKVGIFWQGNPHYQADRDRSIPLSYFGKLAGLSGVRLVSLQKGPGREQLAQNPFPVVDFTEQMDTEEVGAFMDTAAVLRLLDLVISSDSAVLHLAGALGLPAWAALSYVPDWRWLLGREDTPWYPAMRLFRQKTPGDWNDVFERIAAALKDLLIKGNSPQGLAHDHQEALFQPDSLVAHTNQRNAGDAAQQRPPEAGPKAHTIHPRALQEMGLLKPSTETNQEVGAETYFKRGLELAQQGKYDDAVAHYRHALQLQPGSAGAYNNLGNIFVRQGKLVEAVQCFHQAVRYNPSFAQAHSNLGNALRELGNLDEAVASLRTALSLSPRFADAHNNLALALRDQGHLESAVASCRQAVAVSPGFVEAWQNLGEVLKDQGRLDEALSASRAALKIKPDAAHIHSNIVLMLNYHPGSDARAIQEECARWNQTHALPLKKLIQPHANTPDPERRLRIGYVSPDFRDHVDSFFLIPLLSNHDHKQYEIVCYANVPRPDVMTGRLKGYADLWRSTVGLSDQQMADLVRSDQIDILIDLELHVANNRLLMFARKPAPVQVAWLGYPGTTGLSTIDYRLTDPYLDPPGLFDAFYAEESIRLPDTFWCYDPLSNEPAVNALPALQTGIVTFGCLNNFCKVNEGCLSLWAKVLRKVPRSRFLLRAPRGQARDIVIATFQKEGIAESRIEFIDRTSRQEYLSLYHRIDLGLDPLPYNGHTTSLDAFWMGVPTLTLLGQRLVGRAGYSQLCNLGLSELAAQTPEEYVELAARWAGDLDRLAELRASLRERMSQSPLMDGQRFARHMEQAYRHMWRAWCERQGPAATSRGNASRPPSPEAGHQDNAETYFKRGLELAVEGNYEESVASYQKALRLRPDSAAAHNNLGNVFARQGKFTEAGDCFQQALRLDPAHVESHVNLGNVRRAQDKFDEALEQYQHALRLDPDHAVARNNMGAALQELGRLNEAEASLRQALYLKPDYADALRNLGIALWKQGKMDEALAPYQEAIRLQPNYAEAYVGLGNVYKDQGRLDEALAAFRTALHIKPNAADIHSNLPVTLNYHPGCDARAVQEECARWNRTHADPLKKLIEPHTNRLEPERRLRIGYVSADFREHVDSFFLIPLLSNHDHEQYQIFCYANVSRPDATTQRLRGCADVWRSTVGLSDQQVAGLVRGDQIDVLVDLELHVGKNRLLMFARKPAPVQVAWLGYPGTTGLSTMDYRLTDPYLDPPGLFDTFYSEESIRLPETFWCYDPLTDVPAVNALPALETGNVAFGCLNNFCKINDGCLKLWAKVLDKVQRSRLLLQAPRGQARETVIATFQMEGIGESQIEFIDRASRQQYLRLYHRIDLCLDPVPCNGHTTSLDAFWMGVPTVTLVSKKTAMGRAGYSQLCNLGLSELAAETPEQYVEIVARWANDLSRLEELRGSLRERMRQSPLMDGKRFARHMEQAYRQMWRRWCERRGSTEIKRSPPAKSSSNDAEFCFKRGLELAQEGKLDDSVASYRQALLIRPDSAGAHNNLGNVLMMQGALDEAVPTFQQALRLDPHHIEAHVNLGNARKEQGRLDEAIACYQAALRLKPDAYSIHSNVLLTMQYHPAYGPQAQFEEYKRWNQQHAESLKTLIQPHANTPEPERRLRIGYVSPDFREHVDAFFLIPLLSNHDHAHYEVFCYADVQRPDTVTERLKGYADVWRNTIGLSHQHVADLVRSDQIDILVDLELHAANNRLLVFAIKPAPVQVAWLGYPGTTGLSTIDYRLTDPYLDPPGLFDAFYSEESIRLPDTFWCYDPLSNEPAVNALPALETGIVTFGCLNNFCKVNEGCLALWAQVLQNVPQSRLLLRAPRGQARDNVIATLQKKSIAKERIEFVETMPRPQYLATHDRIDLGIDPFPYNGHTTSLDAFWMGVPSLTLVGKSVVGRAGLSQLCNLDLRELAAQTPEEYVALATHWASNLDGLQKLRGSLRERMRQSPLMDGKRFARNVESAYRQMWRRWCDGRPTSA
jgi:predicted O-linked N-acetylglucosamine transferase (SPINDLY family)